MFPLLLITLAIFVGTVLFVHAPPADGAVVEEVKPRVLTQKDRQERNKRSRRKRLGHSLGLYCRRDRG